MTIFGKIKRGAESVGRWTGKASGDVISGGGKVIGGANSVLKTVESNIMKGIETLKDLPVIGEIVQQIMSQPLPMMDMSANEIIEIANANIEQTENLLDALEESSKTVDQVINGNAGFKDVMTDFENMSNNIIPRLMGQVNAFDETGNEEIAYELVSDPDLKTVNTINKKMANMLKKTA
eukprot:TRINITY_DN1195_c0_g1_i3.p1 TRINITY_DN1195_c0_g1~~TRINITY_DN1195_c0_g1_i3.p1  ORF type:complete len:179 (+),score=65.86 TRINITY_DN1195_c0_g1_i3:84-620(+)